MREKPDNDTCAGTSGNDVLTSGAGADILVIGRPITGTADPAEAAKSILADLRG